MRVKKAIEISDAKIKWVSLVDKAANGTQFIIAKAKDGAAEISSTARFINKSAEGDDHFVTGIVYAPGVEDAHGNFMTEEEIRKACHWFNLNGSANNDIQHSEQAQQGLQVVESYIAQCDMTIADTPVAKGTWVMTAKVSDAEVWEAIEKGEITGFSMGGIGKYSTQDVVLQEISKDEKPKGVAALLGHLAGAMGYELVQKGEVLTRYTDNVRRENLWQAFYALMAVLLPYSSYSGREEPVTDTALVEEALRDFCAIVTEVLANGNLSAALQEATVAKAGKKMSAANLEKLKAAFGTISDLLGSVDESKKDTDDDGKPIEKQEEINVTEERLTEIVEKAVAKALAAKEEAPAGAGAAPAGQEVATGVPVEVLTEVVKVEAPAPLTEERVAEIVAEVVNKAVAPIANARGVATSNNEGQVQKAEQHYLSGIL